MNFAFHTASKLNGGSGFLMFANDPFDRSVGLIMAIVLVFSELSTLHARFAPNTLNTFFKVFSLNFKAKVKAQDSVINQTMCNRSVLLLTKS